MKREMMSSRRGAILSGGHEFQSCAVDAISKAGRFRPVLEDMALMALTAGAMDFRPRENQLEVGARLDDFRINRLPKARPAGAAVKLVFGRIHGEIAACAAVNPGFL